MSNTADEPQIFTGLILLTGENAPDRTSGLFHCLSEFSIQVADIEQIIISNRLILTVLITLNPVHQGAIENDLNLFAQESGCDIATIFSHQILTPVPKERVGVEVISEKLGPMLLSLIIITISQSKASIESITRTQSSPIGVLLIVSGTNLQSMNESISALTLDTSSEIRVFAL
jgi:predicted amino acid-binding ACT domain protein